MLESNSEKIGVFSWLFPATLAHGRVVQHAGHLMFDPPMTCAIPSARIPIELGILKERKLGGKVFLLWVDIEKALQDKKEGG